MTKKALLVGIDEYDTFPSLPSCVKDVNAMKNVLSFHEDETPNYFCKTLTSDKESVTRVELNQHLRIFFENSANEDLVFYFSGHGVLKDTGGYLATQDGEINDWGIPMNDLLTLANQSDAKSILLIIDCCHSGNMGNPPNAQTANLGKSLTVLAASRDTEKAVALRDTSLFTELVVAALKGGAADIRGKVSAPAVYAYASEILGPWDQRPIYKSHSDRTETIRKCKPDIENLTLRELAYIFETPEDIIPLGPEFEPDLDPIDDNKEKILANLQKYRASRLLAPIYKEHLYFACKSSTGCELTPFGKFYWRLANAERFGPIDRSILYKLKPDIENSVLRKLPEHFSNTAIDPQFELKFNPSSELLDNHKEEILEVLKKYQDTKLLISLSEEKLNQVFEKPDICKLTPRGQFYWRLATDGRFSED